MQRDVPPTPVVLSWSGGKDSALALSALRAHDQYQVVALLTSVTREYDRVSIHGVRRELLDAQTAVLGLPLVEVPLEPGVSDAGYRRAFLGALEQVRQEFPAVRHVAFGDLFLEDVRAYRDQLLSATPFSGLYPLWGRPTARLAREFLDAGFSATLVCTDDTQIPPSFAGRPFDHALLADLPPTADPCGERGEFHTFVHDGPGFARPIAVTRGEIVSRDGRFTYCDLLPG